MRRFVFAVLVLLSGCSLAKGEKCLSELEYQALQTAFNERDEVIKELAQKLEALFQVYEELAKERSK